MVLTGKDSSGKALTVSALTDLSMGSSKRKRSAGCSTNQREAGEGPPTARWLGSMATATVN